MGEISLDTVAYAKIILHAAKYPHCAVNGVLLADATKAREGSKTQEIDIVDAVPLFHHSHNLSPMAEMALTQVGTFSFFNCTYLFHQFTAVFFIYRLSQ